MTKTHLFSTFRLLWWWKEERDKKIAKRVYAGYQKRKSPMPASHKGRKPEQTLLNPKHNDAVLSTRRVDIRTLI